MPKNKKGIVTASAMAKIHKKGLGNTDGLARRICVSGRVFKGREKDNVPRLLAEVIQNGIRLVARHHGGQRG